MLSKITKIIFKSSWKIFLFVFLAVFLSLFSYILWNNVTLSVKDYLISQIKPMVWWDIVLSNKNDLDEKSFLEKYSSNFEIAKTISLNSTIFDNEKNPSLVELIYHDNNYPFYNQFEYDTINNSWTLIVNSSTYEKYWKNIEILWEKYEIKWIIKKSPLKDFDFYNQNTIYLPLKSFDNSLNSNNSRLTYTYYLKFKKLYDNKIIDLIKNDQDLKDFKIRSLEDRNDNISNITDRFYVFINFFNLVIFVLTFFVVILSLETFFKKIKHTLWLLNIFWLKKSKIFFYNIFILSLVFLSSFLLAFLVNIFVMKWLSLKYDFFESKSSSFFSGFLITLILLIVWVFSPFYKIFKSWVQNLLKDDSDFSNFNLMDYFIYLWLIFAGFLLINVVSWIKIFDSFLYSFIFIWIIILFYFLVEVVLKFLFKFYKNAGNMVRNADLHSLQGEKNIFKDFYIFDAIRSTTKPWNISFLIIFSWIISFLSIFVFYVFSGSFLSYLQNITINSNDTFVINVQQNDIKKIKKYFNDEEIYEIVTLKIKTINWKTLEEFLNTPRVWREFSREFFSTTKNLENKILSWKELSKWWVYVDKEFASSLWLKLWDKIDFTVAGLEKKLIVENFREAVRNWANPFFYFQLDKEDFVNYPKNYILSYKESSKEKNLESILSKEVWNHLTFIKTREIIEIVISIAEKILLVVYFCLFYIFIFTFLSFIVSLTFLWTFKTKKIKTLNILWWDLKKLKFSLNIEFSYLLFLWFLISFIFWILFLYLIFYFVKYFSLDVFSFWIWTLIILWLLFFMIFYLYLIKVWKTKNF